MMTITNSFLLDDSHHRCMTSTSVAEGKQTNKRFSGRKHSEETKRKMSITRKGMPRQFPIMTNENHPGWKGDDVGYFALHAWMRRHLPKPNLCQNCDKITKRLQVACVTAIYSRDFSNWKYLCYKCHYEVDLSKHLIDMSNRKCSVCQSSETYINKDNGRPRWFYSEITNEILCNKCKCKEYKKCKLKLKAIATKKKRLIRLVAGGN